ncbi:hypothetical protein, partial [Escherichia coli]|uniref:hypothetical protein n=1 Tax=Escherichia coli TaxID=562 RepID=UPI0019530914
YVTIGASIVAWLDPSLLQIDDVATHVAATAKNWWQVGLIGGIALGAFLSARLSGARRNPISPIWTRALGSASPGRRFVVAFAGGFL